jgi:iduronate 2-sulfatase
MRKLLFSILAFASSFSLQAASERPNVLFIAVDDLKPVLGCYGNPIVKTPNMDRLADRGVLFERAYVNQAVCSPSRNTLMLGLRPQTLGIYDLPTHFRDVYPDAVTMSQTFMKNGYRAEAIGKIYHAGKGNHNDELSWSVPHWTPKGDTYSNPANAAPSKGKKGAPTEAEDVPDITYQDAKTAEEAISRLKKAKQDPAQPFLLMVGFSKPHLPFVAPKKYWDLFVRICLAFRIDNYTVIDND